MFACQNSFERDEDVASETLHPTVVNCAEPMRIRSFRLEIAKQGGINPARIHFRRPLLLLITYLANRGCATNRLPPRPRVATLRILERRRAHHATADLCKKLPFASRQALPILAPVLIVSVSRCASIMM